MEQIILDNWAVMGEYDHDHHMKLVVDEYGSWHRAGTEIDPTHIFGQQITIRDALLTALTLDCFNRHPEKVSMANCAQLVNNLNALFLAHEEKFWATPNFHVFEMYAAHQDAQAVRSVFAAPRIAARIWRRVLGTERIGLDQGQNADHHRCKSQHRYSAGRADLSSRSKGRFGIGNRFARRRHSCAQHI